VQLSVNALEPAEHHLRLGAALAPLREDGVLVLGSGNVVHNLGAVSRSMPDAGFDWARRFDEAVREVVLERPTEVAALDGHPDAALAVPTPDHFVPLLYVAGIAGATGATAGLLVDGFTDGSLSMASYTVGLTPLPDDDGAAGSRP
jgi:4,5-DOPA dioxygenase extradiol